MATRDTNHLQGRKTQHEAAWIFIGAMQGKTDIALKYMKQRRYREVARYLEEMKELSDKFDALPMNVLQGMGSPSQQSGGLPAGDKD